MGYEGRMAMLSGFDHLTLIVDDLEAATCGWRPMDSRLESSGPGNKPGTHVYTVRDGTCGVRVLVLRDPSRD